MRSYWLALLVLPLILFAKEEERGFFFTIDQIEDEALHNLVLEECSYPFGEISPEDFDSQGLSLLEMDERDESLTMWSEEKLASEKKTNIIEKKGNSKKLDEAFSYELLSPSNPALENISDAQEYLIQINGLTP